MTEEVRSGRGGHCGKTWDRGPGFQYLNDLYWSVMILTPPKIVLGRWRAAESKCRVDHELFAGREIVSTALC